MEKNKSVIEDIFGANDERIPNIDKVLDDEKWLASERRKEDVGLYSDTEIVKLSLQVLEGGGCRLSRTAKMNFDKKTLL